MGCLIDDPSPCTIKDDVSPDPRCVESVPEQVFKVEYVTADGTIPSGRYAFVAASGLTNSQAETACKHELQWLFNTDQNQVDLELLEVAYFRGNICGAGFRVKNQKGDIKVKRTRRAGANSYDYTLELTCTNY
jgi:hypothetical protein